MTKRLIKLGVDINGSDESRGVLAFETPLHHAIYWRRMDRVRFLLMKGADARAKTRGRETALELARRTGGVDLIALVERYDLQYESGRNVFSSLLEG